MNIMHANPVGITNKDIYIIKNDINDKVYIGQSINSKNRFQQHCKPSQNKTLIDRAINKYGREHFWYEILESNIEDYNEKEQYWIQYYNSVTPNGYNMTKGGENPPIYFGDQHFGTKLSDNLCQLLKDDLKNTDLSLITLAKKYYISKKQILRINQGISRVDLNETYPLRKHPNQNGKLTDEDVDLIIELLKYTYFFNGEIARMFDVNVNTISKINNGKQHHRDNVQYPIRQWKSSGIRPVTYEQVSDIIDLLLSTDLSFHKISQMYNVDLQLIQNINNGSKKYYRDNFIYPIRSY